MDKKAYQFELLQTGEILVTTAEKDVVNAVYKAMHLALETFSMDDIVNTLLTLGYATSVTSITRL